MKKTGGDPGSAEKSSEGSFSCDSKASPERKKKSVDLEDLPVWKIVKLHKKGLGREEIREELTGLSKKEVKVAVSHYYCNRRTVENKIKREEEKST